MPLTPELVVELRKYLAVLGEEHLFPPKTERKGNAREWTRGLKPSWNWPAIQDFRFHDLRHTFASWYMMNGGDLYELAKILGHSNIKMTERYAKMGKSHIARTGRYRARDVEADGRRERGTGQGTAV